MNFKVIKDKGRYGEYDLNGYSVKNVLLFALDRLRLCQKQLGV